MKAWIALAAVVVLFVIGYAVGPLAKTVFVIAIPYLAFAVFLLGIIHRIAMVWGRAPVPFPIGTTCGQQKSLSWIKNAPFESPSSRFGVLVRLLLEVFLFRSLFRNTRAKVKTDGRAVFRAELLLWALSMVFHWSLFLVLVRHLRLFFEPVPRFVALVQAADSYFELAVPSLYLSGVGMLLAASALFLRRILSPRVRYVSLPSDYFQLFLLIGIASTGLFMRYIARTDVASIKEMIGGLFAMQPVVPENLTPLFLSHLFLVCVLFATLPFGKLVHVAGVLFSPTRNLRCNSREVRHENPLNRRVHVRTYAQYEEEYRDKMVACDLPVEHSGKPTRGDAL